MRRRRDRSLDARPGRFWRRHRPHLVRETAKPLLPERDLVREYGLALEALRGGAALARVEHAEDVFAGDDRVAALGRVVMVGLAHCSRQVLSFISPRRIQLFMVPSGTSMRWA